MNDEAEVWRARRPLVLRLLGAFLFVSLLPIGTLAFLSWRESRVDPHAEGEAVEGHAEEAGETVFGLPIATVELIVGGASLALSALMAIYVSRTVVRPIRELEGAMSRVEAGDLEVKAPVRSGDELGRLAASFNGMVEGVKREAFIRDLFGQYVTPSSRTSPSSSRGSWTVSSSPARSSSPTSVTSAGSPRRFRPPS